MFKFLVLALSLLSFSGCATEAAQEEATDPSLSLENTVYGSYPPTPIWNASAKLSEGFTLRAYDGSTVGQIDLQFVATKDASQSWKADIYRLYYVCSDGSRVERKFVEPNKVLFLPSKKGAGTTFRNAATCPSGMRPVDVLAEFEVY